MVKPNPGKLKDEATKYLNKGKLDKALEAYQELEKVSHDDLKVPQKIAEIMLKMGKKDQAIAKYKDSAEKYRQRGFLVQAIAIYKVIQGLAPDNKEVNDLVSKLMEERTGAPIVKPKEKEVIRPLPEAVHVPTPSPKPMVVETVKEEIKKQGGGAIIPEALAAAPETGSEEMGIPLPDEGETALEMGAEPETPDRSMIALSADEGPALELGEEPSAPAAEAPETGTIEIGPADQDLGNGLPPEVTAGTFDPMDFMESAAPAQAKKPAVTALADSGLELDVESPVPAPSGETGGALEQTEEGDEVEVEMLEEGEPGEPSDVVPVEQEEELPAAGPEKTPLFSDLQSGEFERVFELLTSVVMEPGAVIVKEGESGDSIFIVARGEVRVTRHKAGIEEREVAILGPGSFFGEMGYFHGDRKATVTAVKKCLLLEMGKSDLDQVVAEFPRVKAVLQQFYRERVLQNLLADSPLFRELAPEELKYFQEHFEFKEYKNGETIVKEGEPGDSMFMIKSGAVSVRTQHPVKNETVELARLKGGDFFGEVGLVKNKPRTATIVALEPTELLELSRAAFQEIAQHHPEIGAALEETIEQRVEQTIKKMIEGLE